MLPRTALLLSAFVLAACASAPSHSHARPDTLDSLDAEYEHLMTAHGLAEWNEYTHEQEVAPGTLDRLRAEELALFERARPIARAVLANASSDAETRRRAQLWLDGALGLSLESDPEIARLSHQLEARLDAHLFERNGQRLTRAEVRQLSLSPNPDDRRAARALEHGAHADVVEIARALLRRRVAVAHTLGSTPYGDVMLRLRGIAPEAWDAAARELLDGTRATYTALLARAARDSHLEHITPADATYALSADTEWTASRLPADGAVAFARRLLGTMGFDLDHPSVRIVVREFAFGGQTLSIHVPDDVRTVLRPQAGQHFYSTLLHELGHALQATRNTTRWAIFRGYEWVPGLTSPGFDEGVAETFGTLLEEPDVLEQSTAFTADERSRLVSALRRNALVSLRNTLAMVAFERGALADPDQDLDALQRRFDRDVRGLDAPDDTLPTWANTPFLATYPMYMQSYVLASMLAAQVHRALRERFGERWLGPDAGRWLTQTLFADGERSPWQDRVRAATGQPLSTAALITRLNSE